MNVKSTMDCVKMESLLLNKLLIKTLVWQTFSLLFDAIELGLCDTSSLLCLGIGMTGRNAGQRN